MAVQIVDYTSLLAASADWLNRADLTDQLPAFVTLTEAQFNRDLRVRDMMVRATTTSNLENVDLPPDWLEHYSLVIAPGGPPGPPLRYISERESNDVKAEAVMTWNGVPFAYTIIGNAIELVPAPANDVDLNMVYYQRIPSLGAINTTNWLLAKSPDLYLYSVLMQSAPYLKDDDRLASWAQLRAALVEGIRMESEASLRPRSGLVARPKQSF
jgi:hypothetical protein